MTYAESLGTHYAVIRRKLYNLKGPNTVRLNKPPKPKHIEIYLPPPIEYRLTDLTFDFDWQFNFPVTAVSRPKAAHVFMRPPETCDLDEILSIVCKARFHTRAEVRGNGRTAAVSLTRHIVFYLGKKFTFHTCRRIGQLLGGFDHTSVDHGVRRIVRIRPQNPELDAELSGYEQRIVLSPSCL